LSVLAVLVLRSGVSLNLRNISLSQSVPYVKWAGGFFLRSKLFYCADGRTREARSASGAIIIF
jgi:hypothetical protein